MKKHLMRAILVLALVALLGIASVPLVASPTEADTPVVPITADEAFDAVTMGIDPATGMDATVALVDVRDPMEIFWSGAPAAVDEIHLLDGGSITPDRGKVRSIEEGKFLEYHVGGNYGRVLVTKAGDLTMRQIAVNVPLLLWSSSGPAFNTSFVPTVHSLANSYDVLILFCRTGGRAWMATNVFDRSRFDAVYVIDAPGGPSQVGGFSGSSYSNVYNGYVGFPGRQTDVQAIPSASWMDSGLPIETMVAPITP